MLKEHPWMVTTTFKHDKTTITYDITKPNRSDAVGKVFKLNASGVAVLPDDGDAFDGVITYVDADEITAAYLCGGLRVPIASGATVVRGQRLVAGLGPSSAKGYVKPGPADLTDIGAAPTQAQHNAVRQALNGVKDLRGRVIDFDTTHALVALGI